MKICSLVTWMSIFLLFSLCKYGQLQIGESENSMVSQKVHNLYRKFSKKYGHLKLPRLQAPELGTVASRILSGKLYNLKTVSRYPPIFEIDDFLSREECQLIIERAIESGLEMSLVMGEALDIQIEDMHLSNFKMLHSWDFNEDKRIDIFEIDRLLEDKCDFSGGQEVVHNMIKDLSLDFDRNGYISSWELSQLNLTALANYINKIKAIMPKTKSRHSEQTWIAHPRNGDDDEVLMNIQKRTAELTGFPLPLIRSSEVLQVVRYKPGGHYNCHMDSEDYFEGETPVGEFNCCHYKDEAENCAVCRYATLLYFLNDVEEGGETAFPIANNKTVDMDVWQKDDKRICNLAKNCYLASVVVKPKMGKAILWYSHNVSKQTRWLGSTDLRSHHGGCDVVKGTKWIANQWFNVGPERSRDIHHWAEEQVQQEEDEKEEEREREKHNMEMENVYEQERNDNADHRETQDSDRSEDSDLYQDIKSKQRTDLDIKDSDKF